MPVNNIITEKEFTQGTKVFVYKEIVLLNLNPAVKSAHHNLTMGTYEAGLLYRDLSGDKKLSKIDKYVEQYVLTPNKDLTFVLQDLAPARKLNKQKFFSVDQVLMIVEKQQALKDYLDNYQSLIQEMIPKGQIDTQVRQAVIEKLLKLRGISTLNELMDKPEDDEEAAEVTA